MKNTYYFLILLSALTFAQRPVDLVNPLVELKNSMYFS